MKRAIALVVALSLIAGCATMPPPAPVARDCRAEAAAAGEAPMGMVNGVWNTNTPIRYACDIQNMAANDAAIAQSNAVAQANAANAATAAAIGLGILGFGAALLASPPVYYYPVRCNKWRCW
jgi:hypothetical protein